MRCGGGGWTTEIHLTPSGTLSAVRSLAPWADFFPVTWATNHRALPWSPSPGITASQHCCPDQAGTTAKARAYCAAEVATAGIGLPSGQIRSRECLGSFLGHIPARNRCPGMPPKTPKKAKRKHSTSATTGGPVPDSKPPSGTPTRGAKRSPQSTKRPQPHAAITIHHLACTLLPPQSRYLREIPGSQHVQC